MDYAQNRQYDEMLAANLERLAGIDLKAAAERAGLVWDEGGIVAVSFGQTVRLDGIALRPTPEIDMWQHLAMLQYLWGVDGSLPNDRWIGMGDLAEGGMIRGASFDGEIDRLIAARLGKCAPEAVRRACLKLGAALRADGKADLCAEFHFLPRFPLLLNLWFADDEFPASGKLLVNEAVHHCLGTEAIGTLGCMLVGRICEEGKKNSDLSSCCSINQN